MKAYIGYATSLNYWLEHGTDVPCYSSVAHCMSINDAAYTGKELESLDLPSLGLSATRSRGWPSRSAKGGSTKNSRSVGPEIHVLVPAGTDRNRLEGFNRHCWTSRIPDGSLRKLRPDVLISSPEFSFLQLAGVLTLQQLTLVGYWLCASYRLREDGTPNRVEPITTVQKLEEYLKMANGCYGVNKARQALRWVADGARSPMEAKLAALAALPLRLGGYGFAVPAINYKIEAKDLDPSTLDRKDREYFEIDLYWADKRTGLEYDGDYHYAKDQVRKDKRRINCLAANDVHILCVMFDQLADEEVRTTLMNQLAKLLGVQCEQLTLVQQNIREELLATLFGTEFAL